MNKPAYQCSVCENKWFDSMEALHAHEQEFHNPQEDTQLSTQSIGGAFPCPECGVQMETPELLEEHVAQEHPARAGMGEPQIRKAQG